jgi:hypothetical protein
VASLEFGSKASGLIVLQKQAACDSTTKPPKKEDTHTPSQTPHQRGMVLTVERSIT